MVFSKSRYVTWKTIAPIFASVAISPWNLLVGGLLISHTSLLKTFFSILFGYSILGIIFVLYGGIGYKKRKQSAQILTQIFQSKLLYYVIPLTLAFGQIGWAGINFELGGRSLAAFFHAPAVLGILVYGILLTLIALLDLRKLGITKFFIVISTVVLMVYLFFEKLLNSSIMQFITYTPEHQYSLFWAVSVVVASFISFATVTPDFFKDVQKKQDVVLSTFFGAMLPGVSTCLLGAFLFFNKGSNDLIMLLSSLSFPLFLHIFNVLTNSDGAIAIYTPGLKFTSLFGTSFKKGILIAGGCTIILALLGITSYLEVWLKVLSIVFPVLIGVCFSAFLFQREQKRAIYRQNIILSLVCSVVAAMFLITKFPPVIISLITPLLVFSMMISYTNLSALLL